jgi:signal transduction histidine kinase
MLHPVAAVQRRTVLGFPATDVLLALLLCAVAVVSVLTGNPNEGAVALTLPVAIVSALALAWRRRSPVIAVALLLASGLTQTLLTQAPGSLWSLAVYAIVMYSLAAHYPEGRAALVGVIFVVGLIVEERIDNGVDYLFVVLLFGGLWLLGRASRLWLGRVTRAEQHQADLARIAVAEERVSIARDLHDIVAHSLSVIAVQADAAEAALQHHPDRAVEPVRVIRSSARDSLADIRRLLHVLRMDDDTTDPAPGLEAMTTLIGAAHAAGIPLELSVDTGADAVPAIVDLAAYRIVQESLTNVIKHAPGMPTRVTITRNVDAIQLEVTNVMPRIAPRDSTGAGLGLVGIRERVAALDGALSVGPTGDGHYRVHATLPLEQTATRAAVEGTP